MRRLGDHPPPAGPASPADNRAHAPEPGRPRKAGPASGAPPANNRAHASETCRRAESGSGVPSRGCPGCPVASGAVDPNYGTDVLAPGWQRRARPEPPQVEAIHGLVVEEAGGGFCGAVVACEKDAVTLEDRFGRQRLFPLHRGAFLLEGRPVTLTRPRPSPAARGPVRSRSGSVARPAGPAQGAKASRIYVEGRHDAELIEQIWGDDLRDVSVVVEYLEGVDPLPDVVQV